MHRVSTTVIAIVGPGARRAAELLGRAANVGAALPDPDAEPLDRAVEAWRDAPRTHLPYLVHDADPLALVADAWARHYDGEGPAGELEVAVAATLARWRARAVELPDYYVVLDADALGATRRHWYLGFLHAKGPVRVVPARDAEQAAATPPRLPAGRWWPPLDRLLDGVAAVVPDRVGSPADDFNLTSGTVRPWTASS